MISKLNGKKNKKAVHDTEIFMDLIKIERNRVHRGTSQFSLILLKLPFEQRSNRFVQILIEKISKRIRSIDQIGYYQKNYLGILLPNTNLKGANNIADILFHDTLKSIQNLKIDILCYPNENIKS